MIETTKVAAMVLVSNIMVYFLQLWNAQGPSSVLAGPTVQLDRATVVGVRDGEIESFLGITYAQPPVGDLRLRSPQRVESYHGIVNATAYGHSCHQQVLNLFTTLPTEVLEGLELLTEALSPSANVSESEDCLNLNIVRPANVSADAKLPVVFWIYGGSFTTGSNVISFYNGTVFVQRSVELNEPVIWVALNYRLNVLGFLGGKEVKEAGLGNLGLHDQRAALRWVHEFIAAFGGDPSRVTMWGESAGAISVFLQLFANGGDTEGLFRAGIMSSGFAVPTGDLADSQNSYDFVVDHVGCSNETDPLGCLRTVPAEHLLSAANNLPPISSVPFLPRADGSFVTMSPMELPKKGKIADVPFITGDTKDEGTFFPFGLLDITTDDEVANLLSSGWFPGSSVWDLTTLLELYPSDPAAGSPFDTGDKWAYSPRCRLSPTRTVYNFLSARGNFPGVGDFHRSDLFNSLGGGDMGDYFIRFVRHLDPNANAATGVQWPPFKPSTRATLQFNEGNVPVNVTVDDERLAGTQEMTSLTLRFPA